MKAILSSADEIKETLPSYNPARSEEFHRESTKIADKTYEDVVKRNKNIRTVILLSGGSASGKTEYLSAYLADKEAIILDGTLSNIEGFKIKYKRAIKQNKQVEVHAIIPDDLIRAFTAFLGRERKYSEKYFYQTHSQSRAALLKIANHFENVSIILITSYFTKSDQMKFEELSYDSRKDLVDYLESIQHTENEIIEIVSKI